MPCPRAINDCAKFFNGVDINDHDATEHTASMQTNRWHLCTFFWLVDCVIHSTCINAIHLCKEGVRPGWAKHANKHEGRKRFQIDAGLALMECGIRLDWEDVSNESTKPEWMRQADCMPCNCGVCFFCKEGKTCGINHQCQKTRTEKKSQ